MNTMTWVILLIIITPIVFALVGYTFAIERRISKLEFEVKSLLSATDCKDCIYQDEADGEHCYECVKGIEDKFEPKDTDECPMQAFYEMKQDACKEHNGNCKECDMGCDIEDEDSEVEE